MIVIKPFESKWLVWNVPGPDMMFQVFIPMVRPEVNKLLSPADEQEIIARLSSEIALGLNLINETMWREQKHTYEGLVHGARLSLEWREH
jgi:hypothetical protein